MKTDVEFIESNSYILYGIILNENELADLVFFKNPDGFREATSCDTVDEARDAADESGEWNGLGDKAAQVDIGIDMDEYANDDGEYMVGLRVDPEYFTITEMVSGIWSAEQIEQIDLFFEGTEFNPHLYFVR